MHHQQQAHEANCLLYFGYVVPFSWFTSVGDGGEWGLDLVQQKKLVKIKGWYGMVRTSIKRENGYLISQRVREGGCWWALSFCNFIQSLLSHGGLT